MASSPTNSDGDFQDPLENYDPKQYDDPLEQALGGTIGRGHQASALLDNFSRCAVRDAVAMLSGCTLLPAGHQGQRTRWHFL